MQYKFVTGQISGSRMSQKLEITDWYFSCIKQKSLYIGQKYTYVQHKHLYRTTIIQLRIKYTVFIAQSLFQFCALGLSIVIDLSPTIRGSGYT